MSDNTYLIYLLLNPRYSSDKKAGKKVCWSVNLMNDLLLVWVISEQRAPNVSHSRGKRTPTLAYHLLAYQRSCLILWSRSVASSSSPVDQFGSDRKCPESFSQGEPHWNNKVFSNHLSFQRPKFFISPCSGQKTREPLCVITFVI